MEMMVLLEGIYCMEQTKDPQWRNYSDGDDGSSGRDLLYGADKIPIMEKLLRRS